MSGGMSSSEAQNVRCQECRVESVPHYKTIVVVVSVKTCMSQGKVAFCQGVKVLSPINNIFGVTGTDAKDAYLTGEVNRPAAAIADAEPTSP